MSTNGSNDSFVSANIGNGSLEEFSNIIRAENDNTKRLKLIRRASSHVAGHYATVGALSVISAIIGISFIFAVIYLFATAGFALICIGIGSWYLYLRDCPGQSHLPYALIGIAFVSLITATNDIVTIFKRHLKNKKKQREQQQQQQQGEANTNSNQDDDDDKPFKFPEISITMSILRFVHLGLFIYLAVLVFNIYDNVTHNKSNMKPPHNVYCGHLIYWISFWYTIIHLIEIGSALFLCFSCCCCCCCGCCGTCNTKAFNETEEVGAATANKIVKTL